MLKSGNYRIRDEVVSKLLRKENLHTIYPLYTVAEAEESLEYFRGVPFKETVTIGKNLNGPTMTCRKWI